MLYLGNFSYNDNTSEEDNYCLMPCVVQAEDTDEALDKFATMFERIKTTSDLLEGASEIYLDSLVELEAPPEEAVLTQWQKIVPSQDGLCSIAAALPETDLATANAYGWDSGEVEEEIEEEIDIDDDAFIEEAEEADEEPFLTFDEQ